jgi:hypothetical protein
MVEKIPHLINFGTRKNAKNSILKNLNPQTAKSSNNNRKQSYHTQSLLSKSKKINAKAFFNFFFNIPP